MAMVSCRECGHGVSDSAPHCPNCGVASPGGQAQLEVKRVARVQGAAVPLAVWVDSAHVGNLGPGKSLTLTVAPGVHRLQCQLQQAHCKEAGQEVEVPAGRRLVVTVATSRWNGTPSFTPDLA
jgi:hypothetical protein